MAQLSDAAGRFRSADSGRLDRQRSHIPSDDIHDVGLSLELAVDEQECVAADDTA